MNYTRAVILGGVALITSACHYFTTEGQINYGLNHYKMGLFNQAIPPLLSAAKSLEKKNPPDPRLVEVLIALGTMASAEKREDLAADFYPRALKAAQALQPTDNLRLRNALVELGMFYSHHERAKDAVPLLERSAAISGQFTDQEFHAIDLDNLANAHQNLKQYDKAIELQSKALEVAKHLSAPKYPTHGTILHNLGRSYMGSGRLKEAEPLLKQGLALLSSGGSEVEPWRIRAAKKSYAELLRHIGRADEAEELEKPALQPAGSSRPANSAGG